MLNLFTKTFFLLVAGGGYTVTKNLRSQGTSQTWSTLNITGRARLSLSINKFVSQTYENENMLNFTKEKNYVKNN